MKTTNPSNTAPIASATHVPTGRGASEISWVLCVAALGSKDAARKASLLSSVIYRQDSFMERAGLYRLEAQQFRRRRYHLESHATDRIDPQSYLKAG